MTFICDNCGDTVDPDWGGQCFYCRRYFCEDCPHDQREEEAAYKEWYEDELRRTNGLATGDF